MIEEAVNWAVGIAADAAHGYDQANRWGPDYDCSSFVITAYEKAGAGVKTAGATYTGNMKAVFLACGFEDVTAEVGLSTGGGLERGDVLLNHVHHTAMYIGGGQLVQAGINEKGAVTGGVSGDQSGGEIAVRSYYNYPWDCVLRYIGDGVAEKPNSGSDAPGDGTGQTAGLPMLSQGSSGDMVCFVQQLLLYRFSVSCGSWGTDGDYGPDTARAVRTFQEVKSLEVDGVVGPETWEALLR